MAKQIQYRRGTTTEHTIFTGATGEVTVDVTKKVAVIHDGVTVGGFPLASARDITAANVVITQHTGQISQLNADIVAANAAIAAGTAVAAVNANVAAANARISALETNSSVTTGLISALIANAGVQQNQITGLAIDVLAANAAWQSNTGDLYTSIQSINSNVGNLNSIGSSISPSTDNAYDLGTYDRSWGNVYVSNSIRFADSTVQNTAWQLVTVPTTSKGQAGDTLNSFAADGTYLYYCTDTYTDGSADIWKRIQWSGDTW